MAALRSVTIRRRPSRRSRSASGSAAPSRWPPTPVVALAADHQALIGMRPAQRGRRTARSPGAHSGSAVSGAEHRRNTAACEATVPRATASSIDARRLLDPGRRRAPRPGAGTSATSPRAAAAAERSRAASGSSRHHDLATRDVDHVRGRVGRAGVGDDHLAHGPGHARPEPASRASGPALVRCCGWG